MPEQELDESKYSHDVPADLVLYRSFNRVTHNPNTKGAGGGAFRVDPDDHLDGCSVWDSPEKCAAAMPGEGVASITVADLRSLGLRVVREIADPEHYLIWGGDKVHFSQKMASKIAHKTGIARPLPD